MREQQDKLTILGGGIGSTFGELAGLWPWQWRRRKQLAARLGTLFADYATELNSRASQQAASAVTRPYDAIAATLKGIETRQIQISEHFADQLTQLQNKVFGLERRIGDDG